MTDTRSISINADLVEDVVHILDTVMHGTTDDEDRETAARAYDTLTAIVSEQLGGEGDG